MITSNNIDKLISERTNDFSEQLDLYLKVALDLEQSGDDTLISRAQFIRHQCNGESGLELFEKNRYSWGIPNFSEGLIAIEDFRNGFLWRFRDHTTSWSDNQLAKHWFLKSNESRFVRRYEFWTCDDGIDECIEVREGDYKEILLSLLKDYDFEVLTSPMISKSEIEEFLKSYDSQSGDFTKSELIEMYVIENPNWHDK